MEPASDPATLALWAANIDTASSNSRSFRAMSPALPPHCTSTPQILLLDPNSCRDPYSLYTMPKMGMMANTENITGASSAKTVYPVSSAVQVMSGDASKVTSPDGCTVQSKGDNAAMAVGTNKPMI